MPHGAICIAKPEKIVLHRLGKIETGDIGQSNFVKPIGIYYELDSKRRKWVSPSLMLRAGLQLFDALLGSVIETTLPPLLRRFKLTVLRHAGNRTW